MKNFRDGTRCCWSKKFETYNQCSKLFEAVSELSESPLATVSVGADRIQTIIFKDPWGIRT